MSGEKNGAGEKLGDEKSFTSNAAPPPRVANPYLKSAKRQETAINTEPLTENDDSKKNSASNKTTAQSHPQTSKSSRLDMSYAEQALAAEPTTAKDSTDDDQKPAAVEKGKAKEETSTAEPSSSSSSDAAWERLPSRNVSFGSAEILTVSELAAHDGHYLDRSVRITGVVLQRHVVSSAGDLPSNNPTDTATMELPTKDDLWICLIVGDPASLQQPSKSSAASSRHHPYSRPTISSSSSAAKTPGAAKQSNLLFKTPATKKTVFRGSNTAGSLLSRRQPGSSLVKTSNNAGLMSAKKSRVLMKRPFLSSIKKTPLYHSNPSSTSNPVDAIQACLRQNFPAILVLCRPTVPIIQEVSAGDLVMVIGQVIPIMATDEGPSEQPQCLEPLFDSIRSTNDSTQKSPIYLQARIARSVNGTDMRLYQEALMIRRKFLRDVQQDANCATASALPPGRAPPLSEDIQTTAAI